MAGGLESTTVICLHCMKDNIYSRKQIDEFAAQSYTMNNGGAKPICRHCGANPFG